MALWDVELFVKLKTQDPTASTARNTLQRDMGYQKILDDLKREDYRCITINADNREDAEQLADELAKKVKLFVNPNKHTYRIKVCEQSSASEDKNTLLSREKGSKTEGKNGAIEISVLVRFREDEREILTRETLQNTWGYGSRINKVEYGTLWHLYLIADGEKEAREIAAAIAVTRSISQGLLTNPHSQSWGFYC